MATTTTIQDQATPNTTHRVATEFGCTPFQAEGLLAAAGNFVRAYCGEDVEVLSGVFQGTEGYYPYSWSEPEDRKAPIYARVVVDLRPGLGYAVRIAAHVPDAYWNNRTHLGRPGRYGYVEPQVDKVVVSVRDAAVFLREEAARVRALAALSASSVASSPVPA